MSFWCVFPWDQLVLNIFSCAYSFLEKLLFTITFGIHSNNSLAHNTPPKLPLRQPLLQEWFFFPPLLLLEWLAAFSLKNTVDNELPGICSLLVATPFLPPLLIPLQLHDLWLWMAPMTQRLNLFNLFILMPLKSSFSPISLKPIFLLKTPKF